MSDPSKTENARATHEARKAVARPGGSTTRAVDAAIRRYLAAEHYHHTKAAGARKSAASKPSGQR